ERIEFPKIGPFFLEKSLRIDSGGCCLLQGVSEPVPPTESAQATLGAQAESAQAVNISQGLEFETESAQATLGAQPPLINVSLDYDVHIPIVGEYSEGEGATSNKDIGLSDKSVLRSFRFHRARSIALGQEKLPIRVHRHHSTWDLTKEQQVVLENNLLHDLNAFKSLKVGSAGNSLSLRKLKEHYAYMLEKVLSDGTAVAAKKKKELTARSVARTYILYVFGSFLFPTKKGTDVSARYLYLFDKDKVAKKWLWGSTILAYMYYNLGAASRDDGSGEYLHISQSLMGSPRRWTLTHASTVFVRKGTYLLRIDTVVQLFSSLGRHWTITNWRIPDHVQPYYQNGVVRQLNREQGIPSRRLLTEVSNLWNAKKLRKFNPKYEWADSFSGQKWKEFILKKADRGRRHHEHASLSPNAHGTMPIRGRSGGFDQQITELNGQLQKLKKDKEKESGANSKLRETLKEKISEFDLMKETIKKMKEDIQLKYVVDEQYTIEFADLPRQLDVKILECKKLEAKNTCLEAELRQKSGLEDYNQSLSVELNKKPVPDVTLAKKYDDLLAAHEDVKKKLIANEDFEKLSIRVHHHQSMWDLTKEPQVVQHFVKLKGLDMIGAISSNYYNSALISTFAKRWQPETNSFHFKWGEMTPTLDHVNDGTTTAAKNNKGLTARSVAHAYMLYVLGSVLFPTKKGTDVSVQYFYLFSKDKVANKYSWGSAILAHMYYNLGTTSRDDGRQFACCTMLHESRIFGHFPKLAGIPTEMDSDAYEHCTCWKWDESVTDEYSGTTLLNFRDALDNYKLGDVIWDPYRDKWDSAHAFKEVTFFYGALFKSRIMFNPTTQIGLCGSSIGNKASPQDGDVGIHQRKKANANEHGDTPAHQFEDVAE
ncbi:hypothetical protein GIB67_029152, partial [Kingdonia uniflora]